MATMTRIALLADTHSTSLDDGLGPEVASYLEGVDLIVHAGDVYASSVLDWLETFAEVVVARGNGDETLGHDHRVADTQVIDCDGLSLGIVHCFEYPPSSPYSLGQHIHDTFGRDVDVVVFGDTHSPVVARHGSTLIVNPGSPTMPLTRLGAPGTMALLDANGGPPRAQLIQLQEPILLKRLGYREPWVLPPRSG
jgi:hypothetical protein